jgi:hypothetical protein
MQGAAQVGQAPADFTVIPRPYGKEPSPGIEVENPADILQQGKFRIFAVHG